MSTEIPETTSQPLPAETPKTPRRVEWPIVIVVLLALVSIPVWRAVKGQAKSAAMLGQTATWASSPAPTVAVAKASCEDLYNEVTISGQFHPYQEVSLHAKVSGFVDQMMVDIGDQVKAGQLLATLQAPDLVAELNNAIATEHRDEAEYTNAFVIYNRLEKVNKERINLIAQQDLDTAEAKYRSTAAAMAATKAAVDKYQTLVSYLKIVAPFDGVITRRFADPGALIQAGTASDTQSLPLVKISDNYRLRLDFDVSEKYVQDIHLHDPVEVRVASLGGKSFIGAISRFTQKVDELTGTMTTEIEVPNPNLEYKAGMTAIVVLKVGLRPRAVAIPTEAIAHDKKNSVYVVNANHEIEERQVVLGLETPAKFEIRSGLNAGDLVMIGDRNRVRPGQKVEPTMISSLAQP